VLVPGDQRLQLPCFRRQLFGGPLALLAAALRIPRGHLAAQRHLLPLDGLGSPLPGFSGKARHQGSLSPPSCLCGLQQPLLMHAAPRLLL
jgi:hypothetical protein